MMATFFSFYTCSLLSLILLFSLTTGNLLRRADASALDNVCAKTKEPPRCQKLFTSSDHTRSPTANLTELAQMAITEVTGCAGDIRTKVHKLMSSAKDPNLNNLYKNCENLYAKALDQLLIAPEYLQMRSYDKLIAAAGAVGGGVRGCAEAVSKDIWFNQENGDAGVWGDAIDVIAKLLA